VPGQANVLGGEEATLNPVDIAFLSLLAAQRGTVMSRSELLKALWPDAVQDPGSSRELDEAAARPRSQLTQDPANETKLVTVGAFGYVLI